MADIAVENGKNSGEPDAQYSVMFPKMLLKDAAREAVTVIMVVILIALSL